MLSENKPWLYAKRTSVWSSLGRIRTVAMQRIGPVSERLAVAKTRKVKRVRWI